LVKSNDSGVNYSEDGSKRIPPKPFLPFVYQEVRRLTLAAHVALGCRGVSCCGFPLRRRIEGTGGLFFPEASSPGITRTSLVTELAAFAGATFDEFVQWMVQDASIDRRDRRGLKLT
jgi:D-alanine-D-alanine ligase